MLRGVNDRNMSSKNLTNGELPILTNTAVGAKSYAVGAKSYAVGAKSHAVGAKSYAVGAKSYAVGAKSYAVGANNPTQGLRKTRPKTNHLFNL